MKFKIAAHRLSYLASFSYFLFGSAALAYTNTLFPDGKFKILLFLAGAYALFSAIAFIHLIRPHKEIDTPVFSVPVQRMIRAAVLVIPLPFAILYGGVLALSGIACGAGFVGELFESVGQYELAKASYKQRLLFHQALDSKQVVCDLATLGSICDKQNSYREADEYYQEAERLIPLAIPKVVEKVVPYSLQYITPPTSFDAFNAADWYEQPWAWRDSNVAPESDPFFHPFKPTMTIMALPRVLRLLNQIPEAKAKEEFAFAGWAFAHRGESSLMLGKHFGRIDLRPIVSDYRDVPQPDPQFPQSLRGIVDPPAPQAPPPMARPSIEPQPEASCSAADGNVDSSQDATNGDQSSGTIGPVGGEATCIMGVSRAGCVLKGEALRRMFRKMSRETALTHFDFASKFYPGANVLHMREDFPGDPLPGVFLKPTTVRELIPDTVLIIEDDDYAKLFWLGKPAVGNANHPREIDVIFEVDEAHQKPKLEWINWIYKRASESGFAAHVTTQRRGLEALPGELRFALSAREIQIVRVNSRSSYIFSSETEIFDRLKETFDNELRDLAWDFYSNPKTQGVTHLQLFVDSRSEPIKLSDKDMKHITAKARSLGYQVDFHDDRGETGLFSREELNHWGQTLLVKVALRDGSFTTEVFGRALVGGGSSYPFPTDGLPNSHRYTFVDKFDQSIDFAVELIKGDGRIL